MNSFTPKAIAYKVLPSLLNIIVSFTLFIFLFFSLTFIFFTSVPNTLASKGFTFSGISIELTPYIADNPQPSNVSNVLGNFIVVALIDFVALFVIVFTPSGIFITSPSCKYIISTVPSLLYKFPFSVL